MQTTRRETIPYSPFDDERTRRKCGGFGEKAAGESGAAFLDCHVASFPNPSQCVTVPLSIQTAVHYRLAVLKHNINTVNGPPCPF